MGEQNVKVYSKLWGESGEQWSARGRLPDFSFAGYHCGEVQLPIIGEKVNILDFGAIGDGVHDDTHAFINALAQIDEGAILIPPGRYKITDILEIRKSVVLKGAGPEQTSLYFPKHLTAVRPDWGATTSGKPTSNYSWSGGFLWWKGNFRSEPIADIVSEAHRGETSLVLTSTEDMHIGQKVEIFLQDDSENTLAYHLYASDPGDMSKLHGSTTASLVVTITGITDKKISFDRPLRFDVSMRWTPVIRRYAPTVKESGVEHLSIEFPDTEYEGHFTELGYNAIAMDDVSDCWINNVLIRNADSGMFLSGKFCTIQGVTFESVRKPDSERKSNGHHGVYFYGDDNLYSDFNFRSQFIHDITVSHCAGNVIEHGKGVDLCFDHHKRAPYDNLFVDIQIGAGTRLWQCGGGESLGRNCGARGTFWNIRGDQPQLHPGKFGPDLINLVGVETDLPTEINDNGRWFEVIEPANLSPQNIYRSQLRHRLRK